MIKWLVEERDPPHSEWNQWQPHPLESFRVQVATNLGNPPPLPPKPYNTTEVLLISAMAGVNPEAEGWKPYPSPAPDGNVDRRSDNMRPGSTSRQNAVIPNTKFTMFYKGNMCIYDGIPGEKVHEIMLIAAASAKSFEMKSGISFPSFIPTSPSSPQGNNNNLASPQSVGFPAEKKSSICRMQDISSEFPLARRQSLQRFLEKRQNRLGSRVPYAPSGTKLAGNNFCADNTPDFDSSGFEGRDFSPLLLSLEGN